MSADDAIQELFNNYWEFVVSSQPELATAAGDHRFNDKLNNKTVAFFESLKGPLHEFQNQARDLLKSPEVDDITKTDLEFLTVEIDYKLSLLDVKSYLFPISYLHGPPGSLFRLVNIQPMDSKEDFFNLIWRYYAFPKQVRDIIGLMEEGIRLNMVLHSRSLQNYEEKTAEITSAPANESIFYKPFRKISTFLTPNETEEYSLIAEKAITDHINPALDSLSNFVHDVYKPNARPDMASSSLPDGQHFYNAMLNFYVTENVTPQMIHDIGLQEVSRISKEMEEVISLLGFEENLQQFNERIRSNLSMYFETQDEVMETYTNVIFNDIEPKLPQFFKKIPESKLQIKRVPKERAGGVLGYYSGTIKNNSTKGIFFLDSSDLKSVPKHMTITLSLHEAEPGHHFQTSYQNELEDKPLFRRRKQLPLYGSFREGWALYSEYLGREMGLYDDAYMLYGHLSQEIFRACRMVVDTGMHALGWSRDQAIDFMLNNTASSKSRIESDIDRYITWPGQACSYKYGDLKIKEFRSKAEKLLGESFDIKEFHDVILSNSGPMSFLSQQVDKFIASHLKEDNFVTVESD